MSVPKVTDLDHAILGLLAREDLSGYRVRKIFEDTALGNYSSSPGSLYPALARLEKLGLVNKKKKPGAALNVFTIAEKGRRQLKKWIFQKVTRNDLVRNSEVIILRIAFMDVFDDRQLKLDFLGSYKKEVEAYIKELENFSSGEMEGMFASSRFAFDHGLGSFRLTGSWINKLLLYYRKNKS